MHSLIPHSFIHLEEIQVLKMTSVLLLTRVLEDLKAVLDEILSFLPSLLGVVYLDENLGKRLQSLVGVTKAHFLGVSEDVDFEEKFVYHEETFSSVPNSCSLLQQKITAELGLAIEQEELSVLAKQDCVISAH